MPSRKAWCGTTGEDCLHAAANTADDHFEWCGGRYSWTDLAEAIAVLQNASCEQDQSSSQKNSHECKSQSAGNNLTGVWDYSLPEHCHGQRTGHHSEGYWMHPILSWSDAWRLLGREAHTLLTGLLSAEHIPWVLSCLAPCCALLCCALLC